VRNYLSVEIVTGAVTPLMDYNQFDDPADMYDQARAPGLGMLAPEDRQGVIYLPGNLGGVDEIVLRSAPVPFGVEPVEVGVLPDDAFELTTHVGIISDPWLGQPGSNGYVLYGSALLTVEQVNSGR
jgi:hypothetical protein